MPPARERRSNVPCSNASSKTSREAGRTSSRAPAATVFPSRIAAAASRSLNLPFVLVGSLVVERVFLWTAMGQVVFNAVEYYDVPLLLGILSVVGVMTLIAHIVLDVVYVYLDPRLRYAPGS